MGCQKHERLWVGGDLHARQKIFHIFSVDKMKNIPII